MPEQTRCGLFSAITHSHSKVHIGFAVVYSLLRASQTVYIFEGYNNAGYFV